MRTQTSLPTNQPTKQTKQASNQAKAHTHTNAVCAHRSMHHARKEAQHARQALARMSPPKKTNTKTSTTINIDLDTCTDTDTDINDITNMTPNTHRQRRSNKAQSATLNFADDRVEGPSDLPMAQCVQDLAAFLWRPYLPTNTSRTRRCR